MNEWVIYALRNSENVVFYVGFSRKPKRRLKEHRTTYGKEVTMEILQRGDSPDHSWSEHERRWIIEMKNLGHQLKNQSPGGFGTNATSQATREKIRQAFLGRPVTWGKKISASTKGKPHDWTPEGKANAAKTQFKKDDARTKEIRSNAEPARARAMLEMSVETKSLRSKKANTTWWDNATPKERTDRIAKMVAGKDPERLAETARRNGSQTYIKHPELRKEFSSRIKNFWDNMTPEYRVEYIGRRTAAIAEAKRKKKQAA